MKRFLAIILMAALFCSCSPTSAPNDGNNGDDTSVANTEFGVGFVKEEKFNPLTTKNKENLELAPLVYEGLFELDETFKPVGVLCESFTLSENEYRFTIKSGVRFSDGSYLTAEDVVYSLECARLPESYYATRLNGISAIRTEGNDVVITLSISNANLPRLLDIPIISKASGDAAFAIGTGAYHIISDDSGLRLAKNSYWHQSKELPFETVELIETGGIDQLIWGFESMNIDLVTLDPTSANPLQFRGEYETREMLTTSMVYLGFNVLSKTFSSPSMRRAIAQCIDRQAAVEQAYARMADAAELPLHPLSSAYSASAANILSYSPEKALESLKAAGYRDENNDGKVDAGGDRTFTILVNNENKSRIALAQRICESLSTLGISVELREEKWEDYTKSLRSRDFDLYLAEVNLRADFNLDALIHSSGTLNYGGYYSGETDTELSKYRAAELANNLTTASFFSHFAQVVPIAPILFKKHNVVTHRDFFSRIYSTQRNAYFNFPMWKVVSE